MSSTDDILQRIEQANQNWAASLPSGSGQVHSPFDPLDHARLSPSALDPNSFSNNFILPRFASGGPSGGPLGEYGVAIVEPERPRDSYAQYKSYGSSSTLAPGPWKSPSPYPGQPFPSPAGLTNTATNNAPQGSAAAQHSSVYAPYGSSVVSVEPNNYQAFKMPSIPMPPPGPPSQPFDPASLGLPVPPAPGTSTNFAGLYSSSGFDMLSVLARVAARPNQTIQIGPVDTSCAFLVADARRYDQPIVYASDTFARMTGYTSSEIIGKNCRFLQSPDGIQAQGQPRKWTDGQAAWHIRQHISQGKESQSSLINYKKGGRPFINLVTIVPIQWDSDEIAYYVGFQVDLVEQPNAILDRMKDGTYVVNYSLLNTNSFPPKSITMRSIETENSTESEEQQQTTPQSGSGSGLITMSAIEEKPFMHSGPNARSASEDDVLSPSAHLTPVEILDAVSKRGSMPFDTEEDNREWHKLIFANTTDFVHVLSLKGSFLYCSPSSARVLEYEPYELVGQTLPTLCHPSDVVPVMRELKEAGSVPHSKVSLLYRVRRKNSGYMWMAAEGKLHIEPGKGRKSVILIGRPFSSLKMSWKELRQAGGLGDQEFWAKCSPDGKILAATAGVASLLGISQADIVGESLDHLLKPEHATAFKQALRAAEAGTFMTLSHKMKGRKAWMDIVSHFYPPRALNHDGIGAKDSGPHRHIPIIVQMTDSLSEGRKKKSPFGVDTPAYHGGVDVAMSPRSSDSQSSSASSFFKTLEHPSAVSDNAFDELDTTRCTSWQYELHQLQNSTKRLREEKELLLQQWRKRRLDYSAAPPRSVSGSMSDASSSASSRLGRICGNCGRTDSPEWRAGPMGPRTLCNACGLRWAKSNNSAKNSPTTLTPGSAASPPHFSP